MYREYEVKNICQNTEICITKCERILKGTKMNIKLVVGSWYCIGECPYFDGELDDKTIICNWSEK